MAAPRKNIHIQYYALLREERGLSNEIYSTEAANAQELFEELQTKFAFSLPKDRLRVSINDQFEDWQSRLNENDRVVFIAPVAGG